MLAGLSVPHDGSTMGDNALKHAIYLPNISKAEIIILNVVEHLDSVDSSAMLATSREGNEAEKRNKKWLLNRAEKEPYVIQLYKESIEAACGSWKRSYIFCIKWN